MPEHCSVDALPCIDGGIKQLMHDERLDALPNFQAWGASAKAAGAASGDDDLYLSDGDLLSPHSRALATEVGA